MEDVRGKRIFVGLSGGVDSSVTAALLKDAGAEVHGVFIKGWYPPTLSCTWREDRDDAMRVAAHLGIPFTTLDASSAYKTHVIDYLIEEYRKGRTPNPDIMCNRYVKFGAFFEFAHAHGADRVATGHYARIHRGHVLRGVDPSKDQSYFLWDIRKEHVGHLCMPLGTYTKREIRALAERYHLPTAHKRDSQGICFLGSVSIDEFLAQELGTDTGPIVTSEGVAIGTHNSVHAYTIGERVKLSGETHAWYVVGKDLATSTLTVSHTPSTPEPRIKVPLSSLNLFGEDTDEALTAQYRYHGPKVSGFLDRDNGLFTFTDAPKEILAPGQSLVLYRGDTLIGGGIIE